MIYSKTLIAQKDVDFVNIGETVRTDTITFAIINLNEGYTFQWFIKANTTDADIDAIAGDTGTVSERTESITFALPAADFTVGTTYYFALREFDGEASQEVIQVAFTIAQNAVLGQGTSVLNISPLFLPNFTTAERDAYVTGSNALLIYNTTTDQIEQYNPDTDNWTGISAATGDVTGPANSTDNAIVRYDSTTGKLIQNSGITIDDNGNISGVLSQQFDATTAPTYEKGRAWYDNDTNTLSYYDNISGTSIQIGKEVVADVRNVTGSTITNGQVVYINGATGQRPTIALASATSDTTSEIIGIATHDIANNTNGKVTIIGQVNDVDTSGFSDGDMLYVSATAGALTNTPPASPNFVRQVGVVEVSNASNGKILVLPNVSKSNDNNLGTSQTVAVTENAVKSYVDNLDAQNVKLTGSQTIAGQKTFSDNIHASSDVLVGTTTAPEKLAVVSTDTDNSAVGFVGEETGKGTLKITHNKPVASDANASGISINLAGTGTAAQGIYVDATDGGTTGRLLRLRNNGSDKFVVDSNGVLTNNLSVRSTATNNDVILVTASDGSRLGRWVETGGGHGWWELDNATGVATVLWRADGGNNYINAGDTGFGTTSPTSRVDIDAATGHQALRIRDSYTPTSTADSNGQTGQIAWDDNYIYVKTSAGWKRSVLSTF